MSGLTLDAAWFVFGLFVVIAGLMLVGGLQEIFREDDQ